MTWDEYYDKCGEWATSTQINRIPQISSFGPHEQVWEIAQDYIDGEGAARLIRKAVINDVHFAGEEIEEMIYYVDPDVVNRALQSAAFPLTEDQINNLQGLVDDEILNEAARKSGVSLDDGFIMENPVQTETAGERRKRHREEFFEGAGMTMMMDIFIDDLFGKGKKK